MLSQPPQWPSKKEAPASGSWLRRRLKRVFSYVDYPFLMAYRGYGHRQILIVQGHAFKGMALSKPNTAGKSLRNLGNLIKMFLVRTINQGQVHLHIGSQSFEANTNSKGFFEFSIEKHGLSPGWHELRVQLIDPTPLETAIPVETIAKVLIIEAPRQIMVSDIDDTLLVSHITKFFKKLYLLTTHTSEQRKPFTGVVSFYRGLAQNPRGPENPFFFVSSSEWNLYEFLIRFMSFHGVPRGILQLREIKDSWKDFLQSSSHNHKRQKVEHLLEFFPQTPFILIGDNGQHDVAIYRSLAEKYPQRIAAIYIRQVRKSRIVPVAKVMTQLTEQGIASLQFARSHQAEAHARRAGLISSD